MKDISTPTVKLLAYTPHPQMIVATAMRQSRLRGGVSEVHLAEEDIERLIKLALTLKHFSVFEHASFTFAVEGISRACSHQLVRHRFFSFTQQSQRFVKVDEFPFIIPPSISKNSDTLEIFLNTIEVIKGAYSTLSKAVPIEDARFILPNATETKIVATANSRELMHFFKLRLDESAQWEIRTLAHLMFNEVHKIAPLIFNEENLKLYE